MTRGKFSGSRVAAQGAQAPRRRVCESNQREEVADVPDFRETGGYKKLRKALLKSRNARGLNRLPYTDMVEQYMSCWCDVQAAQEDINVQGMQIMDARRGTPMANPSCAVKRQASQEMRKLFACLGFEAECKRAAAAPEDDDEL